MNSREALTYIKKQGVVLASAKGPVPRMTEVILAEEIKGSWWGHPRAKEIFDIFQEIDNSPDILMCRLVNGKITFLHSRLWPAVIRLSSQINTKNIAQVVQEHTPSGRHISKDVPYPDWVPHKMFVEAKKLSKEHAYELLGEWSKPKD